MAPKAGTRVSFPESSAEVMVVRPPAGDGELTCGDTQHGPDGVVLGKRYTDETSGAEVLCVKPGPGPLRFAGRDLVLRTAKPLPASD